MVATALNRPNSPNPESGDGAQPLSSRERINSLLGPAAQQLNNRLLILGIAVVVYAALGWIYWQSHSEHQGLSSEINALKAELSVNSEQSASLDADFALYTDAIATAKEQQILILRDSSILEKILATANSVGVTIASAGISENTVAPLGEDIYEVTPILLQVDGTLANLQMFINELEGRAITAMEVDNSTISNSEQNYTATIRTIVYNRPLTPDELGEEELVPTGRVTNEELDRAAGGASR